MDQDSWLSCEKTALLQGGFLRAAQICQPNSLSALKKEDWEGNGQPIVDAVREISEHLLKCPKERLQWKKKIVCIVWSKVLNLRDMEDIEIRWKEDPLFGVLNSLPEINHAVMFELVKSMSFSSIYVELLLCLPSAERYEELKLFVDHVTSRSTEEDVKMFLEVWWELLKGKRGCNDDVDQFFSTQASRSKMNETSTQASKRFKPDPESTSISMVHILFEGLREIKEHLVNPEMCYVALSNCLDTMYTNYLLSSAAELPIDIKLQRISCIVNLKKRKMLMEDFDMIENIQEAHRDLSASLIPAETNPSGMTFIQAMQVTLEVICSWEVMGLLNPFEGEPTFAVVRLKDSIGRVLASLEHPHGKDLIGNGQTLSNLRVSLTGLMGSLAFKDLESSAAEMVTICTSILDNHLEGFEDLPGLFATKLSQDFNEAEWIRCLERNARMFQTKDLLLSLITALTNKCQRDPDVQCCKNLKDVVVEIFSNLSIADRNATLADLLNVSSKGLHQFLPSSISKDFSEELNLAFNSIIQSGASQSLDAAVAAVARVAFQNPEATLNRCYQMAVFNLGAHTLIAEILQQLPGLFSSNRAHHDNLVCNCLKNTVWSKLLSPQEENQFVQFIAEMMKCNMTTHTGEKQSFIPPENVLRTFVQPFLLKTPQLSNLEFCLRILQCTLSQDSSTDATHWLMSCSPFPLLFCLAQLLNECSRCWDQPVEGERTMSMEIKELLLSALHTAGTLVGKEVVCAPDTWSRALFWLYNKVEEMDWTVGFCLKDVWGEHFKYEVPSSMLSVCDLPEHDWSGLELPQYGQGTGLVAWLECCALSDVVHKTTLEHLSLNLLKPDDVNMFSKGLLVGVCQILPWCTCGEWERILEVIKKLLKSGKLHVPYSLEYVDFLPLLDLRSFAYELRLSIFLLRIFQLLCSSSCSDWLQSQGWLHTGRLYANAMRSIISSVKDKSSLNSDTASPKTSGSLSQEVLFVLTQLFCHVLHVQVMIPDQPKVLFLCALEILTHYEAVISAFPDSCSALQGLNTRHFFTTIADNLQCSDMKAVLHQKIAQL